MKKKIYSGLLSLSLFTMTSFAADISTPLFATFESGTAAPFVLNADGPGADWKTQTIADNPLQEGNETTKCIEGTVPAGTQWWYKTYLKIEDGSKILPASANHKYLHIFMYAPTNLNGVEIGVYAVDGTEIFTTGFNFSQAKNDWQDVVFDLSGDGKKAELTNIGGIWIRPYVSGNEGTKFYFDEFELSDNATSRILNNIKTPLFATFEAGTASPFVLNADGPGSEWKTQVIADNPLKEGNKTNKTIEGEVPAGGDWWHKTYLKIEEGSKVSPASANHKYLHFFMYAPDNLGGAEIGIYNVAGEQIYQKGINFAENKTDWQDVIFDLTASDNGFPGIVGNNIGGIWVRPYVSYGTVGAKFYFDEFELSDKADARIFKEINTPLFATFEDGTASPFVLNADGSGADMKTQVIANNILLEKNTTSKTISLEIPTGADWYHKTFLKMEERTAVVPASASHKYLHIYTLCSDGITGAEIGIFNSLGEQIYQKALPESPASAEWTDLVFDLSASDHGYPGIVGNNIAGIWIRPYGLSLGKFYYFDEFELSNSSDSRSNSTGFDAVISDNIIITSNNGIAAVFGSEIYSVEIYTINGILVESGKSNGATEMSFPLNKGNYIIKVVDKAGNCISKIIAI